MSKRRKRKCRNCRQLFRPDPRNLRHQRQGHHGRPAADLYFEAV